MKNEAIPRLRFRRFTSKWAIKLLNEFSTRIVSKNAKNIYKITFTDSAKYGIIIQTNFFYKHISNSRHISNYYIVKPNDYIYNPRKSNYAPYGPIRRNKLGKTGVVSPLYYVFTTHNMDLYFLDNYFVSNKWYKYIYSHGNTGARADRVSIKIKDLKMMPVYTPSLPEQQLIGKFFAKLDKLIQLQQKKVSLLKKLKRGYLQKLFRNKNKNFINLNKLCDIKTGNKNAKDNIPDGRYPFFDRSTEVKHLNTYDYNEETIIYAGEGEQFLPRYFNGKYSLHQRAYSLYNFKKDIVNVIYLYEFLLTQSHRFIRYAVGSTVKSLRMDCFKHIYIPTIPLKEQNIVGGFLLQLSILIKLHSSKITYLRKLKKAYLQKMFC